MTQTLSYMLERFLDRYSIKWIQEGSCYNLIELGVIIIVRDRGMYETLVRKCRDWIVLELHMPYRMRLTYDYEGQDHVAFMECPQRHYSFAKDLVCAICGGNVDRAIDGSGRFWLSASRVNEDSVYWPRYTLRMNYDDGLHEELFGYGDI